MARVSSVEIRVRYAETDQMGVAYHANYFVWCDIGRTDYIRATGMSYRDLERSGVVLAVTEASIRFSSSALYDDRVVVKTTLSEVGSRKLTFDYILSNAESDECLATARTVLVSLDRSGKVAMLPSVVRDALAGG
ncbi:MAG: acyl-CoA thioesterase [Gemmatimonadaceae bacterium]